MGFRLETLEKSLVVQGKSLVVQGKSLVVQGKSVVWLDFESKI